MVRLVKGIEMISFKAIVVGSLIAIIGQVIGGAITGIALLVYLINSGVPHNKIEELTIVKFMEPPWSLLVFAGGCIVLITAGYITAKISKTNIYICATIVGLLSYAFGLYFGQGSLLLAMFCAFLGAFLWSICNAFKQID